VSGDAPGAGGATKRRRPGIGTAALDPRGYLPAGAGVAFGLMPLKSTFGAAFAVSATG
jgi:hypothetical protein